MYLKSACTLWESIRDLDFMAVDERDIHPSRALLIDLLHKDFGNQRFTFLDVGVLSAVTYSHLTASRLTVDYTGVDFSEHIITDCQRRHPDADWRQMSVCDLAFDDRSFDVVHCRHVLEHLPHFDTAIRELARVCGKYLILCFFIPPAEEEVLRRSLKPEGYVWVNQYRQADVMASLRREFPVINALTAKDERRVNAVYFCSHES